jgi:hypothetical protein
MRDKNGFRLSQKRSKQYLEAVGMLYGPPKKGSVEIVPPRVNLEDLALKHDVLHGSVTVPEHYAPISCAGTGRGLGGETPRAAHKVPRGTSTKQKVRKEWREQAEIYAWTQTVQTLQKMVMMIGNESRRNVVQAAVARRMGLLAGSSDLFIARPVEPYAGLWIECKQNREYTKAERSTDHWKRQEAFQERMRSVGYAAAFAFGAEHGIKIIKRYMETNRTDYDCPPDRVNP